MENKTKETQQKNTGMFENLKQLSAIISGKDIAGVFANIKTAKQSLDQFCKKIKEQVVENEKQKLEKQKLEQAKLKAQTEKVVATSTTTTQNTTEKPHNSGSFGDRNSQRPQNARDSQQFNNGQKGNFNRPNNFDNRQQQGNRPNNYQQGNRPLNNNQARRDNNNAKPNNIVSFTNNKPKPFAKPEVFVPVAPVKTSLAGNKAKTKQVSDLEKKGLSIKEKLRLGHISFDDREGEDTEIIKIKSKANKQKETKQPEKIEITHVVITEDELTVKDLSEKLGKPAAEIIKKLLLLGLMYNINSPIDYPTAELIASEFGITMERKVEKTYEEKLIEMFSNTNNQEGVKLVGRPPVVTVMGHVDHGKTSLLDYIKKSHVIATEAGGITQHIGAYSIRVKNSDITFIDTPGHEAFSHMRQRGATVSDISILIVAADDGVMPQTIEAIKHIKEANNPMIVAVNKIDKPQANIERVKQQLAENDVLIEDWGGDTILVPISAKTGEGVEKLLEMILLVAEVNEFKANPKAPASGTCIEAKVDTGRGIVATIIVKDGTLKVGDYVVCGLASGRVRAMTDYKGQNVTSAGPSMAVSVVGLNVVPSSGDMAYVVDEKLAKNIILERSNKLQYEKTQITSGATLEEFMSQNAGSELKTYKIIIKADVQGTSEALRSTLERIKNEEVIVQCISQGVGIINENDVLLAKSSNAQLIGFNTKIDAKAKQIADKNGVDIKMYKIIYEAVDFVTEKIESMKAPKYRENIVGKVEVRQLFKISSLGIIAGSYVLEGVINRSSNVRVVRDNEVIFDTSIDTLRQQKDEAKQVRAGFECGIKLKNFNDIKVGDIIVAYENVRI